MKFTSKIDIISLTGITDFPDYEYYNNSYDSWSGTHTIRFHFKDEPLYSETINKAVKCVANIVGHPIEPSVEAIDQALYDYLAEREDRDTWYSIHEFIEDRDS